MADAVATHRLTHAASLKMLAAGVAKAEEIGCKVSLAVVDQSCRLIAFLMMDGARHFSIITTQRKAITSASQRMPTGYAPEALDGWAERFRQHSTQSGHDCFVYFINGAKVRAPAAAHALLQRLAK